MGIVVEETKDVKKRLGDRLDNVPTPVNEPAEVDRIFQACVQGLERIELFGAGVQLHREVRAPGGWREPIAGGDELLPFFLDLTTRGDFSWAQDVKENFILDPGPPVRPLHSPHRSRASS